MNQPKTRTNTVREILFVSFVNRIGRPNSEEGELNYCSSRECVITPTRDETLGPGVRVTWKDAAAYGSIFVPITNVARVSYREREKEE